MTVLRSATLGRNELLAVLPERERTLWNAFSTGALAKKLTLLHPDARLVLSNGGTLTHAQAMAAPVGSQSALPPGPLANLQLDFLAPGLVQLQYLVIRPEQQVRCTSIWAIDPTGWRMRFHQETVARSEEVAVALEPLAACA